MVDEDGNIVIFEDRCGIRKKPEIVTQYSSIYGEVIEEDLWRQGKYEESRLRESVNKLQLVLHMLKGQNAIVVMRSVLLHGSSIVWACVNFGRRKRCTPCLAWVVCKLLL